MSWSGKSATQGVSRLGLANGNSDNRELFLKQFAGEVLTSFEEKNVFMPLHRVRTISNGKSAQFPSIGTASADYHVAGTQIFGDSVPHGETTVTVDDLLVSSTFISKIDEAMNHYDVRSTYSKEMGNALANAADKNIAKVIADAAVATVPADGDQAGSWADGEFTGFGGSSTGGVIDINGAGGSVNDFSSDNFVQGVFNALETFDKNDVGGEKFLVVSPKAYYKLFNNSASTIMDRDFGGNGSSALGQAPTIGGVKVLMSNHIPNSDESTSATPTAASGYGSYTGDYTGLQGLIFTKDAAATVKLLDLGVESEYQISRQGTLMVAKYAMGHNKLRGKGAIQLVASAT